MKDQVWESRRSPILRIGGVTIILLAVFATAGPEASSVFAQGSLPAKWVPVIYPNWNQSLKEQEKDKSECHTWAMENSGFDPLAPGQPPSLSAEAWVGGTGAGGASGTASGSLIGGIKSRDQVQSEKAAQEQKVNERQAEYDQKRDLYKRAYAACAQGRGYTVR